jgi:hypothetical protein
MNETLYHGVFRAPTLRPVSRRRASWFTRSKTSKARQGAPSQASNRNCCSGLRQCSGWHRKSVKRFRREKREIDNRTQQRNRASNRPMIEKQRVRSPRSHQRHKVCDRTFQHGPDVQQPPHSPARAPRARWCIGPIPHQAPLRASVPGLSGARAKRAHRPRSKLGRAAISRTSMRQNISTRSRPAADRTRRPEASSAAQPSAA